MGLWSRLFPAHASRGRLDLTNKYGQFRQLLATNQEVLELIADLEGTLAAGTEMPLSEVRDLTLALRKRVGLMVDNLNTIAEDRYRALVPILDQIAAGIEEQFRSVHGAPVTRPVIALEEIGRDLADAVGGKTANLGEVVNRVGLPVPAGFSVTAFAYRLFVDEAGLQPELTRLWDGIDWERCESVQGASVQMTELVQRSQVPQAVSEEIALAAHDLYRKAKGRGVAVRSSAIGEDGRSTFAGQYATYLNCPLEQVQRRYRDVVASKFSPMALFYLHTHGFREEEVAMAVGFFLMVDAVAAGVGYSLDPTDPELDKMVLSSVWGLGAPVVDGTMTPDSFRVSRRPGRGILDRRVVRKERRVVLAPREGVVEEAVPAELVEQSSLADEQVLRLAEYLRALEAHYRCPQDVEWALDRGKRLIILQSRPLRLLEPGKPAACPARTPPVLLEAGLCASPGVGSGPVVRVDEQVDGALGRFPRGGVLVARQTSPCFVEVMTRAAAIVTDVGSPTGHMASLAREYRVPTLVDAGDTRLLADGAEVTVDAGARRIYQGRFEELLVERGLEQDRARRDAPAMAVIERVVGRVARLNLTDPAKSSFRAKGCRTYHDVIRFCHEMAISEMFHLNDYRNLSAKGMAYRLESTVPLRIYLIDLGGGLQPTGGIVKPEQIASVPMRALWRGVTTPGVSWAGARPIDLKGFVSVWANTMYDPAKSERGLGDTSYAILADTYLNFGSRLGYHFTTLDSVCGDNLADNYILFRFKGGAAAIDRRVRRTRFVADVLAAHHFIVDQKQDLLNASVKKAPREQIEEHLTTLGRLIGCARQLDVMMGAESTLEECVAAFLRGDYAFFEFKGES
jgi:pyruvate, water dikinase